jgi:hypothetical protein
LWRNLSPCLGDRNVAELSRKIRWPISIVPTKMHLSLSVPPYPPNPDELARGLGQAEYKSNACKLDNQRPSTNTFCLVHWPSVNMMDIKASVLPSQPPTDHGLTWVPLEHACASRVQLAELCSPLSQNMRLFVGRAFLKVIELSWSSGAHAILHSGGRGRRIKRSRPAWAT